MPPDSLQPTRRNRFIYDTLAKAIAAGLLPDGLVLTESNVSRHFGVSRAPAADALERMAGEGLIFRFDGRGFIVGSSDAEPRRMDLSDTGLEPRGGIYPDLGGRSWRETIYPAIEAEVAGSISYGSFVIGSAALAQHYGFSRTISHEMLTRLERVGLIEQASNARWHAPAITAADVRDHYQIRSLLEPVALNEAAATDSGQAQIKVARDRIADIQQRGLHITHDEITAVEADLHHTLLQSCANARLRETLYRSQLPLIATHTAFSRFARTVEMQRVLTDHLAVLDPLARQDQQTATAAMVAHLKQGEKSTITYIEDRPDPPAGLIPPYMVRLTD